MNNYPRVCAQTDLSAIIHNLSSMQRLLAPGTKIMAVIKTDGYGHGAIPIARELEQLDSVFGYAVATEEEALALRCDGIKKSILILGYSFPEQYEALLKNDITPAIFSWEAAKQLNEIAERLGVTANIHIKIDTGMGRVGFPANEESAEIIARIFGLPHIMTEGIFTHFARADETDKTSANAQLAAFLRMIELLEARGVHIPLRHCSNSAGILDLPQANLDMVRAGITMYGLHPSEEVALDRVDLRPALSLKSRIVHVKELPEGSPISYGGTFVTSRRSRIATIPVGYGDGYARTLSGKGAVLIRGRRASICGRVCMDQFMVDVTDIPQVAVGDEVTLIGADGAECITLEELGALSGRFNYEFACDLGKRIPRVFVKDGRRIASWNQSDGLVDEASTTE